MTFPLPLTAIEHYMLAEDSASYPCCFSIALEFTQRVDERALAAAIEIATRRHPLLRAKLEFADGEPCRWIACSPATYSTDTRREPKPETELRIPRPIDLATEPGLRFELGPGVCGDQLRVEFHHACTDGMGAMQFLSDLVTAYLQAGRAAEVSLPEVDPRRLAHRAEYGLRGWRRLTRLFYGTFGWLGAIEFFTHRPVALGCQPAELKRPRLSGYCHGALTATQTTALLAAAKQQRVTANDLLIRDLFLAVQQFIEQSAPAGGSGHKRIMVPTNLRVPADKSTPATNIVAMINLDRRPQRWKDKGRLLRVLHWEMAAVKRMRLGLTFVQIVGAFRKWFGSLRPLLPLDRCLATCVMSNLGRSPAALEPRLVEAVEFYPPLRPLTAASFGLITHADRLMCSLHFDAAALSAEQGVELLRSYLTRLGSYGAPLQPTAPGDAENACRTTEAVESRQLPSPGDTPCG